VPTENKALTLLYKAITIFCFAYPQERAFVFAQKSENAFFTNYN